MQKKNQPHNILAKFKQFPAAPTCYVVELKVGASTHANGMRIVGTANDVPESFYGALLRVDKFAHDLNWSHVEAMLHLSELATSFTFENGIDTPCLALATVHGEIIGAMVFVYARIGSGQLKAEIYNLGAVSTRHIDFVTTLLNARLVYSARAPRVDHAALLAMVAVKQQAIEVRRTLK